jgi:DNA-binding MarR family transcriptional regulator
MLTIEENKIRPTAQPKTSKASGPLHNSKDVQITSNAPSPMIQALDSIFGNMRIHGISMSSCHAIVKLYIAFSNNKEPFNLTSLASQMGMTTAAMTSIADTMEKLGFAKRMIAPGDRRSVVISLTARGMKFAESFESTGGAHL